MTKRDIKHDHFLTVMLQVKAKNKRKFKILTFIKSLL